MMNWHRLRQSDPFTLSPLGRVRACVAWLRGPAVFSRWLLLLLMICSVVTVAVTGSGMVMQAASPALVTVPAVVESESLRSGDLQDLLRAGPSSSTVVEQPGYECRPMPDRQVFYFNPFNAGPTVVAIDADGVVWGPSCIVSAGIAGV